MELRYGCNPHQKPVLHFFIVLIFCLLTCCTTESTITTEPIATGTDTSLNSTKYDFTPDSMIANFYALKDSTREDQVLIQGKVTRLLADDLSGDKHQQFIIALGSGQTIKVAHNIDLAPRVANVKVGDVVFIYGEYGYNSQGGLQLYRFQDYMLY